jgi:chloramphenicol 3-O-phosphotransferase
MVETLGPAVVLITGVMASGKSTVAQALAERLPRAAHVRGDAFRRMIVSGREEVLPASVADEYARSGWTAVVQDVVVGEELAAYVRLVRTRPLYVVVLAPGREAVAAREAERPKTGYGAGWTVEALDRVLREETERIGLWLDNAGQTPDGTVQEILVRLDEGRVAQ